MRWRLVLSVLVYVTATTASATADKAEYRYPASADHIVLKYSRVSTMPYLGTPDFGLVIYGDGRAEATLPKGTSSKALARRGYDIPRSGVFETRLTPQEIDEILSLVEPAFLVDQERMRRERREQHPGRARTDGATTTLVLDLSDFRPAAGSWEGSVAQQIEWTDVHGDAELYPGVPGIQALHSATKHLPGWVYRIAERVAAEESR